MKRTTRTIRTVALALALAMLMTALALTLSACGNKIVMTFEADNGKTYTADSGFFRFMMTYAKQNFYTQNGLNSSVEKSIWDTKTDEGLYRPHRNADKVGACRAVSLRQIQPHPER